MNSRDNGQRLLMWLQDAYAMEQEAETMLEAMAARIEHYPELKARIETHIEETRGQASRLKDLIDQSGGSPPVARSVLAGLMASMHAAGNAMMSDEVAKGLGISYAFEHMEIASYRSLVIAARQAGREDVAAVCEAILGEEVAMADWLLEHQEAVIVNFLQREAAEGVAAKR